MKLPYHNLPLKKKYAFKSRTEKAIDTFVDKENPTQADLNAVVVQGQIEEGILKLLGYLRDGHSMDRDDIAEEVHNSELLGRHMEASGDRRPGSCDLWDAHAIVSGGHAKAAALRGILAKFGVRIDDPDNGCWLPRNTAAKLKTGSAAVPHSRIHRTKYYLWMESYINLTNTKDESFCRFQLSMIEGSLKNMASLPPYVMLSANAEII